MPYVQKSIQIGIPRGPFKLKLAQHGDCRIPIKEATDGVPGCSEDGEEQEGREVGTQNQ